MTRILIVDDQDDMRAGIRAMLEPAEPPSRIEWVAAMITLTMVAVALGGALSCLVNGMGVAHRAAAA
jgi:CheY-like chemotaxis protein